MRCTDSGGLDVDSGLHGDFSQAIATTQESCNQPQQLQPSRTDCPEAGAQDSTPPSPPYHHDRGMKRELEDELVVAA